jgi:hypothetical protein
VDYGLALLHYGAKSFKIGNHCHLAWRLATTGTVGAHLRVTQKELHDRYVIWLRTFINIARRRHQCCQFCLSDTSCLSYIVLSLLCARHINDYSFFLNRCFRYAQPEAN